MTEHGLLDASTDVDQVREWWARWPNANIGLVTGKPSGVIAIDIDPAKGGVTTWADAHAGQEMPATRESQTGGGGRHILYRHPLNGTVIKTGTNVLGPGVDVRGDGGYIVVPPSIHLSGHRYVWHDIDGETATAPLPPWLLARLTAGPASGPVIDVGAVLAGVPEGQRDSALFRTASKLRWAGVPLDVAETLILQAAEHCGPPFPPALARAKVAAADGRSRPTLVEDGEYKVEQLEWDHVRITATTAVGPVVLDFAEMERGARELNAEMGVRLLMVDRATDPYGQRLNLLSVSARESCRRELEAVYGKEAGWAAVLSRAAKKARDQFEQVDRAVGLSSIGEIESIPFLVHDFMPADGPTILFGAGASAKTYLSLSIALAVATGGDWLGRPTEQRSVLYVDYETGEEIFGYRLRRLMRGLGILEEPAIWYWDAQGMPLAEQLIAVRQAVERHNCGMLIVDHAAAAAGVKPEESDAALRVQRALGKFRIPSLLIAHITGEGERDPKQVLRPYGSIFWRNMARCMWYVNGVQAQGSNKTEVGLYGRKLNDGPAPGDFGVNVFFEEDGGPVRVAAADLGANAELNAMRGQEWLIWEAFEGPFTVKEAARVIGRDPVHTRVVLNRHREDLFEQVETGAKGESYWRRRLA